MMRWLVLAVALLSSYGAAQAEPRVTLGWARIFTNDQIGDGEDRWRSGSYSVSRVRGASWAGYAAAAAGDIVELRGHASVIAPANLTTPVATDRRYAGLVSLGLNTHFGWQGNEVALGGELAMTGPRSGVGRFHSWFHEALGMVPPSDAVLGQQIGTKLHPGLGAEIGRSLDLGPVTARPFVEARTGVESLFRVGGDLTLGGFGADDLMLRDVTTGHRYRAVEGRRDSGLSLTLGGDIAHVAESALLPESGSVSLRANRYRLRTGLHWQGDKAAAFYGVSYLSREFDEQPQGQLVGAFSLALRF